MVHRQYNQLDTDNREDIAYYLRKGYPVREIARAIGCCHTTIYRELNRNRNDHGRYVAIQAQRKARERRKNKGQYTHLKNNIVLNYVHEKLECSWSPEQISGRIGIDITGQSISHEAIYQYCYRPKNRQWCVLLPTRRKKRKRRCDRRAYRKKNPDVVGKKGISERPKEVDARVEEGHWEGDCIIGKGQRSAVAVFVERATRMTFIAPLADRTSFTFAHHAISLLGSLPPDLRRTLTLDNGSENARHKNIERITGMQVYFCQPYHSWEKGTVENTNGLIRRQFPKSCDFNMIDAGKILEFQRSLNNRPRKILNYLTPQEAFDRMLKLSHSGPEVVHFKC